MRWGAIGIVVVSGCLTSGDCDRRLRAAELDGLRDAGVCRFDPGGLDDASCGLDPGPLLTYYGIWCATAPLSCIREDAAAEAICFGDAADTGGLPTHTKDP